MEKLTIDDSVYYIEHISNKTYAYTEDNIYLIKISYKKLNDELPNNFYYANPYTIVNLDKVKEIDYVDGNIILENGVKIDKIVKKYYNLLKN